MDFAVRTMGIVWLLRRPRTHHQNDEVAEMNKTLMWMWLANASVNGALVLTNAAGHKLDNCLQHMAICVFSLAMASAIRKHVP
jgi:hypothetical protein